MGMKEECWDFDEVLSKVSKAPGDRAGLLWVEIEGDLVMHGDSKIHMAEVN